MPVTLKSWEKL